MKGVVLAGAVAIVMLHASSAAAQHGGHHVGGHHSSGSHHSSGGHRPAAVHHPAPHADHDLHYHGYYYGYPYYSAYPYDSTYPRYAAYPVEAVPPPGVAAPWHPVLGLGVWTSSAFRATSDGYGALGRIPFRSFELELDLGSERWGSETSTRGGGALLVDLMSNPRLTPYVLAGGGVKRFDAAAGSRARGYLVGGAGAALPLSARVRLTADLRWYRPRAASDDAVDAAPLSTTEVAPAPRSSAVEARLAAIYYF